MKRLVILILSFSIFFSLKADIISEEISFEHNNCMFKGTLTKPDGPGPFPAIIIVPGSGQTDRDGTIPIDQNSSCLYPELVGNTLTIYKDLAHNLTDSGFAVLRYDDLLVSCPGFQGNLDFETLWLPFDKAIDLLKNRTDILKDRIVLAGHSEGATLIPYVANYNKDLLALINLGGTRTPFDSVLARQIVDLAFMCEGDTTKAKNDAEYILNYYNGIRNKNFNLPYLFGVSPAVWYKYINICDSVAINYMNSNLPSLFIGFEDDFNVPPSELIRFQNELEGTFDFYSIPDVNHYMTLKDNPKVEKKISDTIVYWLRQIEKTLNVNDENINIPEIKVYPNPFSDKLNIQFPHKISSNVKIKIYNTLGRELFSAQLSLSEFANFNELNLNMLSVGTYFIQINFKDSIFYKQIIKIE